MRRFAEQNDVEYYVHDTAWLINFDDFMSKINPQGEQVKCEMPLLRNKHDSLIRFNRTHKYAVDKHTIDRCTASDNVSKFLHGRIWIINYRELEKEKAQKRNAKNYETDIIIAEGIETLGYFYVGINKRNRIGRCDS